MMKSQIPIISILIYECAKTNRKVWKDSVLFCSYAHTSATNTNAQGFISQEFHELFDNSKLC